MVTLLEKCSDYYWCSQLRATRQDAAGRTHAYALRRTEWADARPCPVRQSLGISSKTVDVCNKILYFYKMSHLIWTLLLLVFPPCECGLFFRVRQEQFVVSAKNFVFAKRWPASGVLLKQFLNIVRKARIEFSKTKNAFLKEARFHDGSSIKAPAAFIKLFV